MSDLKKDVEIVIAALAGLLHSEDNALDIERHLLRLSEPENCGNCICHGAVDGPMACDITEDTDFCSMWEEEKWWEDEPCV